MQVMITGKNLDIGTALRSHIEDRLKAHVAKYFDRAIRAEITVEKQKSTFATECIVHLSTGLVLTAKGTGGDAYSSFDVASEHLEKRLRRYTRRLKNHHRERKKPLARKEAPYYTIASRQSEETEESEELNPVIIAESTHSIKVMSVGEAVMELELSDTPFVLFTNDRYNAINIVYRRSDGNIGWIDPSAGGKK